MGLAGIQVLEHTLFLGASSGHYVAETGKKVAAPAESGISQSIGLTRKKLKVNLCKILNSVFQK